MKTISYWAKANPRKAQASIVMLYIVLNIIALGGGILIYDAGIHFENFILDAAFIIFFLSLFLYKRKANYYYRKTLDFFLVFTTFSMIAFWGNRMTDRVPYTPFSSNTATGVTIKPPVSGEGVSERATEHKTLSKKEWRKAEKEKTKKEKRKIATWLKVLLILLVVASAIFLSYLVAILSCNISCSGAEGLAIVVLVLGLTGAIGGGFVLIRRILGYRNRRRMMEEPSPSSDDY